MKNEQMNVDTQNVDTQNVDTQNVDTQNVDTAEKTPEQIKAAAVLRARLPHLTAHSLNFEKRTGNFFRASMIVGEDGTERMTRKVLADVDCPAECAEEMRVKRAAAVVLSYDADARRAAEAVDAARKALADAEAHSLDVESIYGHAVETVTAFELPERSARVKLADTVAEQAAKLDKYRALLIAAGIDPDAM